MSPLSGLFAVETIFKSLLMVIFVQIIHDISNSHDGIQKYAATIRLDTSPVAFHKIHGTSSPSPSLYSEPVPPFPRPPTDTRTDLVPEFDLSIPTAGDHLGGFMWMPQCTYAHLVMSLDPVVQLGGLPVPNVQLSIRIS